MATLTETASMARKGIKFGSIGLVGLTVLWFVGVGVVNFWKATHPEPPPPPTVDFGALPAIIFPESKANPTQYQLQTPDGKLGVFPDRMQVFYAPTKQSGFLDPDLAKALARRLNFFEEPVLLSETVYRFTKSDVLPTSLQINIVSGRYTYRRQWQADPSIITNKRFISDRQAILDAQAFLRLIGQLHEDVIGQEVVSYWRVSGDQLISAISLSEADFVRVDFYRKPFEILGEKKAVVASYPFYSADPTKGLISVLVSGSADQQKKVVDVEYNYIPVAYDVSGMYPLKTVELAFEELKAGKGNIASLGSGELAVVRRVGLGYYESLGDQQYAMPVYTFSGDQNFVAYVSAVDEAQINNQTESQ